MPDDYVVIAYMHFKIVHRVIILCIYMNECWCILRSG